MGTTNFGAVPYALYSASTGNIDTKLNISDTAAMLNGRFAKDTIALSNRINANANALNNEISRATAAENLKLNISDTAAMLSAFARDTISISNRINANTTALNSCNAQW
jgi:glutamate-1-semialdehyde aminotransferase